MFSWLTLIQKKIQGYGEQNKNSEETIYEYQRAAREGFRRASRAETIDFIELKVSE
jgi:hypothetical protein